MTRVAPALAAILFALAAQAAQEKAAPEKHEAAKPAATQGRAADKPAPKPGVKPESAKTESAKPDQTQPDAAKGAPARAGAPLLPGGDSREPIAIDADKLEWFDKEQKAIYTGNVVARQGEGTLKASQLRIFLLKSDKAAPAAGPTPGAGVAGDNQIERMEADGPVELIQKDQTATGDKGVYERGSNAVTLIGNVALRQGGHVTYGERLVYDLDTRQAVVQKPRGTFAPRNPPAGAPKR